MWVEHCCLGKNHISGTLSIPAAKSIPATKSRNFVDFTGVHESTLENAGTRYIIINMELIISLKSGEKAVM